MALTLVPSEDTSRLSGEDIMPSEFAQHAAAQLLVTGTKRVAGLR